MEAIFVFQEVEGINPGAGLETPAYLASILLSKSRDLQEGREVFWHPRVQREREREVPGPHSASSPCLSKTRSKSSNTTGL